MAVVFSPKEHMTDLKGKAYLEVKWRLVWWRGEKPNWTIDTQLLKLNLEGQREAQFALFRAVISDENGAIKAVAHGSETAKDFYDFIEKAETKAVGRALAYLGYGTQFAPELDELPRVADSPVERRNRVTANRQSQPAAAKQARPEPENKEQPEPEKPEQEKPAPPAAAKPFTLEEAMATIPFKNGSRAGMKMAILDRRDLEWIANNSKANETLRAKAAAVLAHYSKPPEEEPPSDEEPPEEFMKKPLFPNNAAH